MSMSNALRRDLHSQLLHWSLAIDRLRDLDDIASPVAWAELERQTGAVLRAALSKAAQDLTQYAIVLNERLRNGDARGTITGLQMMRREYLRTETTLDFFADAINTRTTPRMGSLLAAADTMAAMSMHKLLSPLGHSVPPVVTYVDKGLGASILKAGLRLWDRRSVNPVASIKVTRHNLLRPTALLHEAGHQIAHIVGWNEELGSALSTELPGDIAETWGSWASEVAADAFAFVNAGYASVAALRNVVDGGRRMVFRFFPGDPHPVAYLRVLLGVAMCRLAYGSGPWDQLAAVWRRQYPVGSAPSSVQRLMATSIPALPAIAELTLRRRYRAFAKRSLASLVDARVVSPAALDEFERTAGPRVHSSPDLVQREAIRLLALSGYRFATEPEKGREILERQLQAMLVLGGIRKAA